MHYYHQLTTSEVGFPLHKCIIVKNEKLRLSAHPIYRSFLVIMSFTSQDDRCEPFHMNKPFDLTLASCILHRQRKRVIFKSNTCRWGLDLGYLPVSVTSACTSTLALFFVRNEISSYFTIKFKVGMLLQ